ncbi:hypothetical protein [Dialister invisus]|uniref:hypothetical protein n=1 Tax=Dialister invisus TaxID=218538 RepID=UPI003520EC84
MADTLDESHARRSHQPRRTDLYDRTGVELVVARAADGEFAVIEKRHLPLAAALEMCRCAHC